MLYFNVAVHVGYETALLPPPNVLSLQLLNRTLSLLILSTSSIAKLISTLTQLLALEGKLNDALLL